MSSAAPSAPHTPAATQGLLSLGSRSRRIGIVTLLGVGAVALFMAYTAWPVIASVFAPYSASAGEGNGQTPAVALATSMASYKAQVDGRSLFFIPRPKRRDASPIDTGPRTPPAPTSYGGPPMIAMINGAAWFNDGRKITPGAETDRGLRVISLDPPWGARVQWQGVEFTIPLFNRDALAAGGSSPPTPDSTAPPVPKAPAPAAKPDAKPPPEKVDRPEDAPPDAAPPSPAPPAPPPSDPPAPARPATKQQSTAGTENR